MKIVETEEEARKIARDFASQNQVNETRAEVIAEVWFDAGKDAARSTPEYLRQYLCIKFNRAT